MKIEVYESHLPKSYSMWFEIIIFFKALVCVGVRIFMAAL